MTKKEYLYKNKEDIFNKRLSGMLIKDLAALYNVNRCTMGNFLSENNIQLYKPFGKEDVPSLIQDYNDGLSLCKTALKYHISPYKVTEILNQNNIRIRTQSERSRKYSINEQYFDIIDTPNKAYILGLLYADGTRDRDSNNISISLQERDKKILDQINQEIGSNRPLWYVDNSKKKDAKRMNQWRLSFCNERMARSLFEYGLVPCKEFKTTFPNQINEKLWRHFIRGYMDGDGCVLNGECKWTVTGNKPLLLFIKDYLQEKLNIYVQDFVHHNGRSHIIRVSGGRQVKKLLDFLYEDAEMFIERKYKIYLQKYKQP